jgi:phosphoglycolate phosphatase
MPCARGAELPESAIPLMVERYRHHYLSRDHELQLFDGGVAN